MLLGGKPFIQKHLMTFLDFKEIKMKEYVELPEQMKQNILQKTLEYFKFEQMTEPNKLLIESYIDNLLLEHYQEGDLDDTHVVSEVTYNYSNHSLNIAFRKYLTDEWERGYTVPST